jgi:hypothetical protein
VRLHQADGSDQAILEAASAANSAAISLDWRIAAGYFLALARFQQNDMDAAAQTLMRAAAMHDEHGGTLLLFQKHELDRLKLDVQSALAAPPSNGARG